MAELARAWRVFATVLAFGSFGVGGVLLWLLAFPALGLFVRSAERRTRLARRSVQWLFTWFIRWMRFLRLITFEIHGTQRLQRRGLLILANHPTLIDVVFLISLVADANCVVKGTLVRNPFTRGAVRATGYICNNSGTVVLQACIDSVAAQGNLIIFPEGTRTRAGQAVKMQRGAAQIATRGQLNITPVRIRCEPPGLGKGQRWWRVASRPLHFTIGVEPDIEVLPFLQACAGEHALAARRLTEYLVSYFSEQGGSHADAGA